jgi:hypothetical protein
VVAQYILIGVYGGGGQFPHCRKEEKKKRKEMGSQ